MPFPLNGVVQMQLRYRHLGQQLMNVFHYKVTGIGTLQENDLQAAWAGQMGGTTFARSFPNIFTELLPATCTMTDVRVQLIHPFRLSYNLEPINIPGTRGTAETANLDAVVTKRTESAGRREVGDLYIPGMAIEDQNGGFLENSFKAMIQANVQDLKGNITLTADPTSTLSLVLFHRNDGSTSLITSLVTQPEVRVMTRRTVGRGI